MNKDTFFLLQHIYLWKVFHHLHNIRPFLGSKLLADGGLAHVDGGSGLVGDDTDFLGGEAGTKQAAGLHFLVGEEGAEAFLQASVEPVVEAVDEGVEVFPYDEFLYGHLVVA